MRPASRGTIKGPDRAQVQAGRRGAACGAAAQRRTVPLPPCLVPHPGRSQHASRHPGPGPDHPAGLRRRLGIAVCLQAVGAAGWSHAVCCFGAAPAQALACQPHQAPTPACWPSSMAMAPARPPATWPGCRATRAQAWWLAPVGWGVQGGAPWRGARCGVWQGGRLAHLLSCR